MQEKAEENIKMKENINKTRNKNISLADQVSALCSHNGELHCAIGRAVVNVDSGEVLVNVEKWITAICSVPEKYAKQVIGQ